MQTSFCLEPNGYSHTSRGLSSWCDWRSGQRHTRQYITCGRPFRWDTCKRPSSERGIVTHLLGWPGLLKAFSRSSMAPFFFFSFFTSASTAFSAHFSSSSPCFQPSRRFTAGLVKEKRLDMEVIVQCHTRKTELERYLGCAWPGGWCGCVRPCVTKVFGEFTALALCGQGQETEAGRSCWCLGKPMLKGMGRGWRGC